MYYTVTSNKSFDQAAADLDAAVKRHGFGVLHVHDLGATLRGKGIAFENECRVFEVWSRARPPRCCRPTSVSTWHCRAAFRSTPTTAARTSA